MTINTTRWSPDTCDCVIEYTWDDSLPNDQIVLTPTNIINVCPFHTAFATSPANLYAVLTEENPRKNIAIQNILDNGPTSLFDVVGSNRYLKKGITINFSWTGTAPNRVVHLTIGGVTLTNNQRNTVQNALNTRFGTGKVILD